MADDSVTHHQLAALAAHLASRRSAILTAWRLTAEADPELTTLSALSRSQFYDHIPLVLDAFEQRLCAERRTDLAEAIENQRESAAGHGLHRWQQGYQQREVMREWRHLQLCLVEELDRYALAQLELSAGVMPKARRALATLCAEGVCESAAQYARLQQAEAAGRVRDLERAVTELKELDRQRAQNWREAAHDLRGNLGIVRNAANVLTLDVPETERRDFQTMLDRGIASLAALLDDLMTLARLEAGQERRQIKSLDVTIVLGELCASAEPAAAERGLFLATSGPPSLVVEGDAVKIRRIAQNLLLNAIKYTTVGGVRVAWEEAHAPGVARWMLTVQDTGPGFADGPVAPLAHVLKEATDEARTVDQANSPRTSAADPPAGTLPALSTDRGELQRPGEGVGLSIVKRMCELLDATMEMTTKPGQGSTFRVVFPCQYERD